MTSTRRAPNDQAAFDMQLARERTRIDVPAVRDFLYGGRAAWETHKQIVDVMARDPVFDKSERVFMNRKQLYKRALSMQQRIEELRERCGWSVKDTEHALFVCDEATPMNLHSVAFEPVVLQQGSPELITKYGELIANRGILGCYLQTELGHGTNVAQLETTATYILATDEFEINSPTLTSTKWWVGGLGKTMSHGVVQARLILPDGTDVGPHLFFVQLRSLEDHTILPRIKLGDIGPKAMGGFAAVDNGFARFDHLRIPRWHMLSKFAHVTREGKYVQPPHSKLSYGGMLYIRSTMVTGAGRACARAATVAIRYATVRRQSNKGPDGLELQVISYPSVYYRLLPILSRAYVYTVLGRTLSNAFDALNSRLQEGDMTYLAEMHAVTSGLKVLVTTTSVIDVETARRSMGGHGFSAFAGLARVYADNLPSVTYEGDNYVLDLQVVRASLKAHRLFTSAKSPSVKHLTPTTTYLRFLLPGAAPASVPSAADWTSLRAIVELLELRAARVVDARARAGDGESDASAAQRVSRAVTEAFVAVEVAKLVGRLPLEGHDRAVVEKLFRLYLLITTEGALVDILAFGLLPPTPAGVDPTQALRIAIKTVCEEILPESIGLTDAFGYTDWEIDSALGVQNGRVYEALWERVQKEPLNQTEVPDGYEEYIKPTLLRGQRIVQSTKFKL